MLIRLRSFTPRRTHFQEGSFAGAGARATNLIRPAMRLPLHLLAIGALLLAGLASPAMADTVDQSFFSPNFNFQGFGLTAQTYTASLTGDLAGINLNFLVCSICSAANVPVSIHTVVGGLPTSTVLGSTTIPVNPGQTFPFSTLITFSQTIPQVAGAQYAIVVDFSVTGTNVTGEFNDSYTGGVLLSSFDGGATWSGAANGFDISFQTHVDVQAAYNFIGFLPPVRNDGSSIFRSGRTIPIKFQLTAADASFITNAVATLQVFKITDVVLGTTEETIPDSSGASNTANIFRFDATTNQYIYNLSTAGYSAGTYLLRVTLNDGTTHEGQVSIR